MSRNRFISISKKLVLALGFSALVALILAFSAIFIYTFNAEKEKAMQSLSQITQIMGQNLIATIEFDDKESARLTLESLKLNDNVEAAFILKEDKSIFTSYHLVQSNTKALEQQALSIYNKHDIKEKFKYIDMKNIIVSTPIVFQDNYLASFCIISNTKEVTETIQEQLLVLLVVFLASMGIVFIIAFKIQKIFTSPIFRMKNAMEKISNQNSYNTVIEARRNDEFGFLFDGFNKMIETIQDRTSELHMQKEFVQTLLDSQEQIIITTDGTQIQSVNETFLDFYAVDTLEEFKETFEARCICDTFNLEAPLGYIQSSIEGVAWIDYIISSSDVHNIHKVMITREGHDYIFSVSGAKLPGEKIVKSAVFTNITEMEKAKQEVEDIHKHTRESIEYASLIQDALVPSDTLFEKYFPDFFTMWNPKDIVGGDIYLFEELRNDDECLLMVIDCTGHGVPGAFVTMLVKAIERQITAKINHGNEVVSPANILSVFNRSMKHLLKQESIDSVSNAGFDGGIIYLNKKEKIIKFAGAETSLFYTKNDSLDVLKGNRYSVGYKKCDASYKYKDHIIEIEEGMKFYLTTDGYLDQNGGDKGFPFGKKRFKNIILNNLHENMQEQKSIFEKELSDYQADHERNDDITMVAFKT